MRDPDALCRCGHPARAHEHWRAGEDCAVCGRDRCPTFRAPGTTSGQRSGAFWLALLIVFVLAPMIYAIIRFWP